MFDGQSHSPASEDATGTGEERTDLEAICARYDALTQSETPLSPAHVAELVAMAGIFDLDTSQPPRALWSALKTVLRAQSPRTPDGASDPGSMDALTLMIVEDDPEMAQDLTALLVDAGHDVVGPFHSAEAAEVAAGLHPIDVALLDINLAGEVDGGALGRSLTRRWGLKIVFLSGDVTAAARHADIAAAMVIKPYTGGDVLAAIQRAAAHAPV